MVSITNFLSFNFEGKPFALRKGSQVFLDLLVVASSLLLSYLLRFEFSPSNEDWQRCLFQLCIVVPYELFFLYLFGIYKQIWRYTSVSEALKIFQALIVASIPLLIARLVQFEFFGFGPFSFSITLINLCLAAAGLIGIRTIRRLVYEHMQKNRTRSAQTNKRGVLLLGAGRAGVNTLLEIKGRGDFDLIVKGFLDDDPSKQGAVINGVKVLGKIGDLPKIVEKLSIDHVILSIAQTSRQNIQKIVYVCESVPIKVRVIPGLYELLQDKVTFSRIRDIQVEDLLGRPAIELDRQSVETFLNNKTVLVTGAGGSIGSELVRQITNYPLRKLILIERSEYALFEIERELADISTGIEIKPIVADIGDEARMASIFKKFAPQVVFHAAAHKHVPLMEKNVSEAVKNNILGTHTIGNVAGKFETEAFVLISTDKAVNPTSVMGATKRVAELVIQELNQRYETRFMAVRFGNVIGSTGSVITTFREQIKRGGPVTVTHPEMERYFMTIPEAANLVLQAGAMGHGGEISILDMGEPVKILDLAKEAIRLSGLKPDTDIQIAFTGIRPGEKLTEQLQIDSEQLAKTRHPKIFIGQIYHFPTETVCQALETINKLYLLEDEFQIRKYLNRLLPEAKLTEQTVAEEGIPPENVQRPEQTVAAFQNF